VLLSAERRDLSVIVPEADVSVSACLLMPPRATHLLALAHGAGAGMRHTFMERLAIALADEGIATLRYQFPYMETRQRRPDPPRILVATVSAAIAVAHELAPDLPLLAGGKSMGGRMTSHAAAQEAIDSVRGLVFFGFPLHPPNRPGVSRAAHLPEIRMPMLFLQGTRDALAGLELITQVCGQLSLATLHILQGADHGFAVLKRSGRSDSDILVELATVTRDWASRI
jgi:predicted alpha/beta-hydrolase family hydrolase